MELDNSIFYQSVLVFINQPQRVDIGWEISLACENFQKFHCKMHQISHPIWFLPNHTQFSAFTPIQKQSIDYENRNFLPHFNTLNKPIAKYRLLKYSSCAVIHQNTITTLQWWIILLRRNYDMHKIVNCTITGRRAIKSDKRFPQAINLRLITSLFLPTCKTYDGKLSVHSQLEDKKREIKVSVIRNHSLIANICLLLIKSHNRSKQLHFRTSLMTSQTIIKW